MKKSEEIKKIAIQTIENEANALDHITKFINDDFVKIIQLIHKSHGRLIITGVGKSANIANKIVATLNSTGTPAIFLHAADAIHGDLGIIQKEDVVMCISKSGETEEIKFLLPLIRTMGNPIIAMAGDINSFLVQQANYVLNTSVEREACPNNLTPTTSTTAQLAMGDALAICLLECKEFSKEDFAMFHPGGTLGKRLLLKVGDIYIKNDRPEVTTDSNIKSVIMEISSKRLGATAVVDNGQLIGIITDGDLRRMLERNFDISNLTAGNIMTNKPKTINKDALAVKALEFMKKNKITQLIVADNKKYLGFIHMHDIIKEGII